MLRIRAETPADITAVRAVNEAAFDTSFEADLVDALRQQAEPIVSWVAEQDGSVVGHILFSPVLLSGHPDLKIMGLAPVAVTPSRQRQGIGSELVRCGLEQCERLEYGAVVLVGHPEYYPRFGFRPGKEFGIACEFEVPDQAFMLLELRPGFLDGATGVIHYHESFRHP